MALRLDTAIVKGEIDSTERGRVRGTLWLLDRPEPVILDLEGDPWRDLAGMKVTFVNSAPAPQDATPTLETQQKGCVGDITASRKIKVFTASDEEWHQAYLDDRIDKVPTEWKNTFYLEWFSLTEGRCVVESADFEVAIVCGPEWQMDEDEDLAQRLANMQAMRSFLESVIQRPPVDEDGGDEAGPDTFSEDAWEEQLKASDRLLAADLEALEKYGEDNDADSKISFVMGWDNLLDCGAAAQEHPPLSELLGGETYTPPRIDPEDVDWSPRPAHTHPLKEFSRELVVRLMRETRASGLNDNGSMHGDPLDRFIANVMQISGKLAGALGPPAGDPRIHNGYTLAITRRCLNWANEALAAMDDLLNAEQFASHRPMFENWRADVFKLREGISDLRRELRANGEE